jgi:HAMP domain-containing protein
MASEITRVTREVGFDGILGGQANVPEVQGVWRNLTENANYMVNNFTGFVRETSEVLRAISVGDLVKNITADVRGETLELKITINTAVDQLNAFANELYRCAYEVGFEGKFGHRQIAIVPGNDGVWKDIVDCVNNVTSNYGGQVQAINDVVTAVSKGDFSKKLTIDVNGEVGVLKDNINTMVDRLCSIVSEVSRVACEVGTEGKLGAQAQVPGVGWI